MSLFRYQTTFDLKGQLGTDIFVFMHLNYLYIHFISNLCAEKESIIILLLFFYIWTLFLLSELVILGKK